MTTHRLPRLLLTVGLTLLCGVSTIGAAPPPSATTNGLQTSAYRIATDETDGNLDTGDFKMPHKVRFFRPGTDAVADRAAGNSKRGTVSLFGNVVVHDSGNATEAGSVPYKGSGPATLTCDQLDVDSKARVYTATGHFHFSQGSRTGIANRATLDRQSGMLHLEGDVHLMDNGATVSADIIDYNLNTKDVQTHGKPTVMTQPVNQPPTPSRKPPPARATPAPRRTPSRTPSPKATATLAPKPGETPSSKPSGAP